MGVRIGAIIMHALALALGRAGLITYKNRFHNLKDLKTMLYIIDATLRPRRPKLE